METIAGGSSELPLRSPVVIDGGRASKKHITYTEEKALPSSRHVVVSNDDLLIEILLRSPAISIIRWKSVSKRWLSLITTPTFALRRSQIPNLDPPSGIFLRRDTESSFEYDFLPLDIRNPASRSHNINFTLSSVAEGKVEILQSCNGLLLCCVRTALDKRIYVCNPSLNLFKVLPKEIYSSNIDHICSIDGIKMAFDPIKSPHYKVIHVACIENHQNDLFTQIQIYSSETCSWSVSSVLFSSVSFLGFWDGIYWNDAIFWISSWDQVTHFNLNVQHPLVRSIKTPKRDNFHKLFESRGCLLLVCKAYNPSQPVNVYQMRNDNSEWLLKYHVNLDDIKIMPLMSYNWFFVCVRSIVLGEREYESFLVLEIDGEIFKYNIMFRTLSRLFDYGSIRFSVKLSSFDGLPFIASFASV